MLSGAKEQMEKQKANHRIGEKIQKELCGGDQTLTLEISRESTTR